ncbi:MAG TPA: FecR family protein, partial [Kofleriaceae bacterium]|nr:FecR family protein [Kofleriaceae bacterium]
EAIGAEPGALERDGGATAVVVSHDGALSVRRAGEETFADAAVGAELYAGDQVRTAAGAQATVLLVDETVVELADETAISIGDRHASAAIASTVAVLYGVARFTVSRRGPGEGPFMVFTPAGIAAAKGTVFGVGVVVTGGVRVGVEEGLVALAGAATLDTAIELSAGASAELSARGAVEAEGKTAERDWATWRDEAEAATDAATAAKLHAELMANTEGELSASYGELDALIEKSAAIEAEAAAYAKAGDAAGYAKAAASWSADLDATFLVAIRAEYYTYAMLSHGYVVTELYQRHPEQVKPIYLDASAHAKGSLLYHKKFHGVMRAHVRPLRASYYDHHPSGRANAKAAGHAVGAFYARTKLAAPSHADIESRVRVALYAPPTGFAVNAKKKVRLAAPEPGWHSSAKGNAMANAKAAPHAGGTWYPPGHQRKARVLAGAEVKSTLEPVFGASATGAAHGKSAVSIGVKGTIGMAAKAKGGAGAAGTKTAGEAKGQGEAAGGAIKASGEAATAAGTNAAGRATGATEANAGAAVKTGVEAGAGAKASGEAAGEAAGGAGAAVKGGVGAAAKAVDDTSVSGKVKADAKAEADADAKAEAEAAAKAAADAKSKAKAKGAVDTDVKTDVKGKGKLGLP